MLVVDEFLFTCAGSEGLGLMPGEGVGDANVVGGRHVYSVTAIVFGGGADIKAVDAMWRPRFSLISRCQSNCAYAEDVYRMCAEIMLAAVYAFV